MSSESKYASGPWHVVEDTLNAGKPRYWIVQNPENWIHRVCAVPDYDHHNAVATARLIASAPELLEALQGILERGYVSECIAEERQDYEKARAAIARALGTGDPA